MNSGALEFFFVSSSIVRSKGQYNYENRFLYKLQSNKDKAMTHDAMDNLPISGNKVTCVHLLKKRHNFDSKVSLNVFKLNNQKKIN